MCIRCETHGLPRHRAQEQRVGSYTKAVWSRHSLENTKGPTPPVKFYRFPGKVVREGQTTSMDNCSARPSEVLIIALIGAALPATISAVPQATSICLEPCLGRTPAVYRRVALAPPTLLLAPPVTSVMSPTTRELPASATSGRSPIKDQRLHAPTCGLGGCATIQSTKLLLFNMQLCATRLCPTWQHCFRIPSVKQDEAWGKVWLQGTSRADLNPTQWSRLCEVGAGSLTSRWHVITEVNIVQGPSSQVTNPSCAADTVLENTDFNFTEEYCSAAAFGRCATRVELPWAVSKHHFHVQKAASFSLDWGQGSGAA
ncbi:uncharacterized protein [Dermacentor albipictus]|uniref:uncharacterized protein isoform X1 n=1 Tax=Dermacentor albipictus TaxID=60249 RepID=UPI0038FC5311